MSVIYLGNESRKRTMGGEVLKERNFGSPQLIININEVKQLLNLASTDLSTQPHFLILRERLCNSCASRKPEITFSFPARISIRCQQKKIGKFKDPNEIYRNESNCVRFK